MTNSTFAPALKIGDRIAEHAQGPINRATLALFAGASYDHMPQHIDIDAAKASGMDDVFGHGMLSMAYLAQMLTHWAPQEKLRTWSVRFTAITPIYASVRCNGEVVDIFEADGERRARIKLTARTDKDVLTLDGEAIVALS